MTAITVKYSCPACGLSKVDVVVPARESEDVVEWMKQTMALTWQDHGRRSSFCCPPSLHDLMIPMPPGADRIGGPTLQ